MPRNGSGVYSADWVNAAPNTTIESAKQNAMVADLVADANAARPITAGGTAGTTAVEGIDNLSTKGTNIASAATTDIGAATGRFVHITGTTSITSFGTKTAGVERELVFDGALTLTHNGTSLILPGAANITTAAGDTAIFVSEGSGNWRCISYEHASANHHRPQTWELIETKTISVAAATADFLNLGAYRMLRLTGYALPATDGATLWARTSTDNGSSWLETASYTNQVLAVNDTTISGARSTDTAVVLTNSVGNVSTEGTFPDVRISQFNPNTITLIKNFSGGIGPTPNLGLNLNLGTVPAGPCNALRIMFSSGNIAAGSYLVLEGIRG